MQNINSQIIQNKTQAIQYEKATQERDLLDKAQKHLHRSQIVNQINQNTYEHGLSDTKQLDYIIEKELNPQLDELHQKELVFNELAALTNAYSDSCFGYLSMNEGLNELISSGK